MSATGVLDPTGRRPFEVFYGYSRPLLRRAVEAMVGPHLLGHVDVDDLVQGAYLALLPRYDLFDNECQAYGYAQRVALSRAMNARRDAAKRSAVWLRSVHEQQPAAAPAADETAFGRLRHRALRTALTRLPADQRRAVVLVDLELMAQADAAAVMGTTPTSVKGLVQRGRARLRKDLRGAPSFLVLHRLRRPGAAAALATAPGLAMWATFCLTVVHTPTNVEPAPAIVAVEHLGPRRPVPVAATVTRVIAQPAHRRVRPSAPDRPVRSASRPSPTTSPTPLLRRGGGACVGEMCAGEQYGDRLCVPTGQEDFGPVCANQGYVGVCSLPHTEYATCERDSEPAVDPSRL